MTAANAEIAHRASGVSELARPHAQLADALWAERGTVYLTGTQALVRILLMQRARDAAAGLNTRGFISGYRGSPLGAVDQAVWRAGAKLTERGIRFLPAINEELGATAVLGTQRVESDPERDCDAVFAMWYGKGPGVDRAGDAIKHGNAYGSSPKGGVLVVAGDDHGCVSSSMPHQSDFAFQAWHMPVLSPANVADLIEFGLYGYALSRYSGNWVGFTALSEVVESAATVDLDAIHARAAAWQGADAVRAATGHAPPADGLHYRWPDLPSLGIETRALDKLAAVAAFARVNSIDREIVVAPRARVGIVTAGKAHLDFMEVLRRLEITPAQLAEHGVRVLKLGLTYPIETTRMRAFAAGLEQVLVIEEKGPLVERQIKELFYNAPAGARPRVLGKTDEAGRPLVSPAGELRPSRLIELVAAWLAAHDAALDRRHHVRDFTPPELLSNAGDAVKRQPYFCAGCPHNTSTKVPEGSRASAGIGCHFMASWMDRSTAGLIQMGGEGVDWVSHSMFTKVPHIFQNLGDGTYYHSGYLAIRQAVAAKATLTYKILFNDAVAMTGGQPVDGVISVDAIARQVESEGVKRVAVLSDDIGKYDAIKSRFPAGTTFHGRDELDAVQRELRATAGVTVLIYEQTCAAEKRRRRKKGELVDPPRRLFINEAVCEGCGDCGQQSNCVAVLPHETAFGRKRRIDQTACNKDYSCAKGFCPSFVSVTGGKPRKHSGILGRDRGAFERAVAALPLPAPWPWTGPYDLLVTGVGGTGVVTVGALTAMAAHLDGFAASVLDFMGFAQKGGAVLSFVRLADRPERLNQVRIDAQQADAILACDLVVGASPEALNTVRHGRTRILANEHPMPVAESVRNPDADLRVAAMLEKLRFAAGAERVETFDAQALATDFLGDTVTANVLALGFAWQRGLVPVSLPALERAVELNGVAVEANKLAFALGRLAAADPAACERLREGHADEPVPEETLEALIERHAAQLTAWQDAAWAARYRRTVAAARERERQLGADATLPFTRAVAMSLSKLMAYKDEYEVARLFTDGQFERQLREQFEGDLRLEFHMAPPILAKPGPNGEPPKKVMLGRWLLPAMKWLARGKRLRGTPLDVFGRTAERRMERELIDRFEARVAELLPQLSADRLPLAVQVAQVPLAMRGFGHVKLANVALARTREAELLHRLDAARYPAPERVARAGQFKGVVVAAGR
ncbi:MAG: indolepyruvate ferredoxin oxidoreductase family protein [Betaproteobacteria bacterium]|nr:indolepyruvate ferredoxin oxidoreductase family protein [Betaproteobacteria bacterium]